MSVLLNDDDSHESSENVRDGNRNSSRVGQAARGSNTASSIVSFRSNSDRHDIVSFTFLIFTR